MRAVVQRILRGRVLVEDRVVGAIDRGLLVYLGMGATDGEAEAQYLADKLAGLRVFEDAAGKINLDVQAVGGAMLVIPQFTLYGDVRRGRRPAFDQALEPVAAEGLYQSVVTRLRARGLRVETGAFRAHMLVESTNDGPITLLVDSARLF